MKRISLNVSVFLLVLVTLFVSTSCMSVPARPHSGTVALVPKDYTIVGKVTYEGTIRQVLGIRWGGASYKALYSKAREMGADEVINISVDVTDIVFLGIYNQAKIVMTGTAIKYK